MNSQASAQRVASAPASERESFIRSTYLHLAGGVLALIVLVSLLLQVPGIDRLTNLMTEGYAWLLVIALFAIVSSVADRWARSSVSMARQYLGLGLFIVAQAIIFLPLLYGAVNYSSPDVIPIAGILTALLFTGLTVFAFVSGTDFSFLRGAIVVGGAVALGLIIASIIFGFTLGLLFSAAVVVLASASILYQTSAILRDYRTDQHVAAALGLLSSVALLFWYVLRIVQRR